MLKSQYNHINHLDLKLNEVTDSVIALEKKFTALEGKFTLLAEKVEHSIQKALNRNTYVLVAAIGFFLTLSKLIDKF